MWSEIPGGIRELALPSLICDLVLTEGLQPGLRQLSPSTNRAHGRADYYLRAAPRRRLPRPGLDPRRCFALAVYETLYGYDAEFNAQPQMVEGHAIENDGLRWDLQLRDGLKFHDGSAVRGSDCHDNEVGQATPDGSGADGLHR